MRAIAATELLLIFPAALFLTALFMRNIQPQQYEPAHTAQRIVDWYQVHPHVALWIFLMAMPFTVFMIGVAALLRAWNREAELRQAARHTLGAARQHLSALLITVATLAAGLILAIVALHSLTD